MRIDRSLGRGYSAWLVTNMTHEELVQKSLAVVEKNLPAVLGALAAEERHRVAGLERVVRELVDGFCVGLWRLVGEGLGAEAEGAARICRCGKRREARSKPVGIKVRGVTVCFPCTYFYCRSCHVGESPVRRWLGVEDGDVSLQFERVLTDLTERMTFGDAVNSLHEQQGQDLDRTQAERITYRVGADAETFLAERRQDALATLQQERRTEGVKQLQFTADGGAIPVGEFKRPAPSECTEATQRTAVRKLPKATRSITGREARLIVVREQGKVTERVVDGHIAPYDHTEVTGERMLAAAVQAGLGDKTSIHGVFDMGRWIHTQFEEQFHAHTHSACADICHVTDYLCDAGRGLVGEAQATSFGMESKRRLLDGDIDTVTARLQGHACNDTCPVDEHGVCVVRVAKRYIDNHRVYLDYPPILARDLPVGSGEAESGIRHLIKKRLDVAGAWLEDNAKRMLALISIRASGLWDEFWRWRDRRDVDAWHKRQRGEQPSRFRGRPRGAPTPLPTLVAGA